MTRPVIFGVAGYKNTGKTMLATRLIAAFSLKGYKVGAIKHDSHGFFAHPKGTDSAKLSMAGAVSTIVADDKGHVAIDLLEDEPSQLQRLLSYMTDVDIVIVEGYKTAPIFKWVLVEREKRDDETGVYQIPDFSAAAEFHDFVMGWVVPEAPVCVVGDTRPVYHRDDIQGMVKVMERYTRGGQ